MFNRLLKYNDIVERMKVHRASQKTKQTIYHYHIRKTGGSTINYAFLSNSGFSDVEGFYERLAGKVNHRLVANDKVFIGWNTDLINEGDFFYAFSHTPAHKLSLPDHVLTITCLRDPVKRVLSHYFMLKYFLINNIDHPCMEIEGGWLGQGIEDFIERVPREHLLNQLYMFSDSYNVDEVVERLNSCHSVLFTEALNKGLSGLESAFNVILPVSQQKKYGYKEDISSGTYEKLREMLADEYKMIDLLKKSGANIIM